MVLFLPGIFMGLFALQNKISLSFLSDKQVCFLNNSPVNYALYFETQRRMKKPQTPLVATLDFTIIFSLHRPLGPNFTTKMRGIMRM
jgi:hypothetical protein